MSAKQSHASAQGVGEVHTQDRHAQPKMLSASAVKRSHYKAQCLSKWVGEGTTRSISTVEQSETYCDDVAYLDTVYKNSSSGWHCQVAVNEVSISLKLDTGEEKSQ